MNAIFSTNVSFFQEKLESQEKKIAEQQAIILNLLDNEKTLREEAEKRHMDEVEKDKKERLEQQATLKQDITEMFDTKVIIL